MESVSCKRKLYIHSLNDTCTFRCDGRSMCEKDGLYKSLNYQLYIDKETRKPPPPPTPLVVNVKLQLIEL